MTFRHQMNNKNTRDRHETSKRKVIIRTRVLISKQLLTDKFSHLVEFQVPSIPAIILPFYGALPQKSSPPCNPSLRSGSGAVS